MATIYNWILNGKGHGKRYMLLLALVFAAFASLTVYFSWENFITSSQAQNFISELPAIEIKDGKLVMPENTYQDIVWTSVGKNTNDFDTYHLVIDTYKNGNNLDTTRNNGIYLTAENAYILNNGKTTSYSLKKIPDIKIEQTEWENIFKKSNIRFSWALFFTLTIALFITFYLWSLIFALLSYFLTLFIPGENYSFPVRRRLSVISLIIAYILIIPLEFLGLYFSAFIFFFLVLILMSFFLSALPKTFIISVDRE